MWLCYTSFQCAFLTLCILLMTYSVQFSRSVMSNSLRPHESEHARPPCPSPTPRVQSDSCPSSQWCHPAISSSVVPFSSCPQSLSSSESFPMSQLFTWGGQTLWDTVKQCKGEGSYQYRLTSRNKKKSQLHNLTLHLKLLEKEEMKNPRVSRRKEILNIRAEINAKETKKDHSKNQQNQNLVLWEDKLNWQTICQTHQETKLEMKMERSQQTKQKYNGS